MADRSITRLGVGAGDEVVLAFPRDFEGGVAEVAGEDAGAGLRGIYDGGQERGVNPRLRHPAGPSRYFVERLHLFVGCTPKVRGRLREERRQDDPVCGIGLEIRDPPPELAC